MNQDSNFFKIKELLLKLAFVVPILVVAIFLVDFGLKENSKLNGSNEDNKEPKTLKTEKAASLVNQHLQLTARQIEIQQQQREAEFNKFLPKPGERLTPPPNSDSSLASGSVSLDSDPELSQSGANKFNDLSPRNIIMNDLADLQKENLAYEEYKAEYKRQYIENARRQGYKVEIDENFIVRRVEPLPKTKPGINLLESEALQREGFEK